MSIVSERHEQKPKRGDLISKAFEKQSRWLRQEKEIRRNGTGKYTVRLKDASLLRTDYLYSSAWSCRTGKRKSHHIEMDWGISEHEILTEMKAQNEKSHKAKIKIL